jgi:hypothetical protein
MAKMARLEPKDERYSFPSDDLYLVGSAEHTLGPIHMGETLLEPELPVRYIGYSTAFRREAGSYGKDMKGILRLHQFDKLEMEIFTVPEQAVAEQEVDLIEEVIRIHGYDKIPAFPLSGGTPADIQSHAFSLEEKIKDLLIAMGYDEIITEPLVNETHSQHEPVLLENSLTAEKTMLRTTLEFSLIRALNEHKKHSLNVIKLFEIGKIYYRSHDEYVEERHLATILWSTDTIDLRSAKGDIELLLERCGYVYTDSLVSMKYIDSKTLYMDLNLDQLMLQKENAREKVIAAPLQNIIKEDFSVSTHGETSGIAQLLEKIKELDSIIYAAELTQGPTKHENGSYNSLITISFYSADISLTKGDVEPLREKVLKLIESID